MKKKGRISGTIGFILALALVGGTVVYSTMFDGNAASKASKPFGDATGSVITGFTGGNGYDETKTLVSDTILGANQKYKSYTVDFSISSQFTVETDGKTVVTASSESGTIYFDGKYSYVKVDVSACVDGVVAVNSYAYVTNVETNETWYRQGIKPQASTGADLPMDTEWSKEIWSITDKDVTPTFATVISGVGEGFCSLNNVKFNFLTGQYEQEQKQSNISVLYSFTVGMMPKIYYCSTIEKANGVTQYGTASVTLAYSNLNNTTVVVPSAVKGA